VLFIFHADTAPESDSGLTLKLRESCKIKKRKKNLSKSSKKNGNLTRVNNKLILLRGVSLNVVNMPRRDVTVALTVWLEQCGLTECNEQVSIR
jgi:hypothetical protein